MILNPSALWNTKGTTGRAAYLGWGMVLMALKYNLDRLIAAIFDAGYWNWTSYWQPLRRPFAPAPDQSRAFLFALLVLALPFIAAGVVLTVRRLRDARWPLGLAALFFVPVVNLGFFLCLCIVSSKNASTATGTGNRWNSWLAFSDPRASALAGLILTVTLAVPLIAFGTIMLKSYGWGLFVGMPFFMGLVSALIHSAAEPRTWGSCCIVAMLSVLFAGLALLFFAIEGLLCVLMAAPLAQPLAILGATVAYWIQFSRWNQHATRRLYSAAWFVLPMLLYSEAQLTPSRPIIEATTRIIIAAPPAVVWHHVITFSELPAPQDLIFRSGIAYPVRARIWGHGVGAVRHCEFSTGPFVEPITVWDEPHRLAFDVIRQPPPMNELSPYPSLHPPHLDGFFRSRHGQFLLTALPDGRTQLDGTTWYDQNLWPNRYWRVWSDYLVHRIHLRVLEHIKAEAEAAQLAALTKN